MRLLTFSFLRNCKLKSFSRGVPKMYSAIQTNVMTPKVLGDPSLIEVCPTWKEGEEEELRAAVLRDMQVIPNFITEQEEAAFMAELEPYLKRMRYEFDHWDNAIQGYRETERATWRSENAAVLQRVRDVALRGADPLPHAHVLDLAAAGFIKPHIDAVRFCGDVIAGLCLLSSAVMRLEHEQHPQYAVHALLARRGLYIMKGTARYSFTHAVLGGAHSAWRRLPLPRARRVALILRTRPHAH